jgi:type IV pilus assembly protein PilA
MSQMTAVRNKQGFTLIELMIVIAIIGVLAAIAIPNFIAYRNKTYCTYTETDANSIAGALADYFSIPTNISINGGLASLGNPPLSGNNSATISSFDTNVSITITVTDGSSRCPLNYQAAMSQAASPTSWWSETSPGIYTKTIKD